MGRLNAVDVGDGGAPGHSPMGLVLRSSNQLRYGFPFPAFRELVGVYIDDLLALLQVPCPAASAPDLDSKHSVTALLMLPPGSWKPCSRPVTSRFLLRTGVPRLRATRGPSEFRGSLGAIYGEIFLLC